MNLLLSDPAFLSVAGAVSSGGETDPYFTNVSLLLHGDGANGSTTIIDSSTSPKTVTAVGNAQISTAIADPFGRTTAGVLTFDGSGDYLTTPDSPDWDISGDYTIEFWSRLNAQSGTQYTKGLLGTAPITGGNGFGVGHYQGTLSITQNSTINASASAPFLTNTWQHVAVVRSGSTITGYVGGISVVTTTAQNTSSTTSFVVGNYGNLDPNRYLNGRIDDLRITKGVARYTSSFTPPTAPFPDA